MKNLAGYGYSQGVTIIAQLMVVPFFIAAWGVEQYGEWLVLTGIPMLLALFELGVAQAAAVKASFAAGQRNEWQVRNSLDTAFTFTVLAALGIVSIGFTLGELSWAEWMELDSFSHEEANVLIKLMSLYLACNLLAGPLDAWLKALDHTALSAFLMANRRAIDVGVTAAALVMGAEPHQLAAALVASSTTTAIVYYFICWILSPFGPIYGSSSTFSEFKAQLTPSLSYMAQPVAQMVSIQAGIQILNIIAGPALVVAFTMARTLARLLLQVGMVFNNALRPELARLFGRDNSVEAYELCYRYSAWATILAVTGLFALSMIGPTILQIWSLNTVEVSKGQMLLLASHAALNVAWFVPATLLFARNRHGSLSLVYFASVIATNLCWWLTAIPLTPFSQAALALLIPEMITSLFLLHQQSQVIGGGAIAK